jgi:hypothetical protein
MRMVRSPDRPCGIMRPRFGASKSLLRELTPCSGQAVGGNVSASLASPDHGAAPSFATSGDCHIPLGPSAFRAGPGQQQPPVLPIAARAPGAGLVNDPGY